MKLGSDAEWNRTVEQARAMLTAEKSTPKDLRLDLKLQRLSIVWQDGEHSEYDLVDLRHRCPCAVCRAASARPETSLPVLNASAGAGPLRATNGRLVGNYALSLEYSDGHNTGIYDYAYLRALHAANAQQT